MGLSGGGGGSGSSINDAGGCWQLPPLPVLQLQVTAALVEGTLENARMLRQEEEMTGSSRFGGALMWRVCSQSP